MEESSPGEFRKMLANFDAGVLVLRGPGDEAQSPPAAHYTSHGRFAPRPSRSVMLVA